MRRHGDVCEQPAARIVDIGGNGTNVRHTQPRTANHVNQHVAGTHNTRVSAEARNMIGINKSGGLSRDHPRIPSLELQLGRHCQDRLSRHAVK